MSRLLSFCAVCFVLCSVSAGQWLETTIPVGDAPWGLLWNPISNKVYCACEEGNRVYIIDGAANHVIGSISVPGKPARFALDWHDNKVYCSCAEGNRVAVICGYGDTLAAMVRVGDWPWNLVYCPAEEKVYVQCADDERLDVIDTRADTVMAAIPLTPYHDGDVVWNPSTNRLFLPGAGFYGDSGVYIVDCASDSVTAVVPVGRLAYNLASWVHPTTGRVYVCCEDATWVISPTAESVVAVVRGVALGGSVGFEPHGNRLYASCWEAGSVYWIDCHTDSLLGSLPFNCALGDIVCDSVGGKLYIVDGSWQADQVHVMDARSDTVLRTIPVGNTPVALAWNSTNSRVYVANYHSDDVSVIKDDIGIAEVPKPRGSSSMPEATIVRSCLMLPSARLSAHCSLLSTDGRKVMVLQPGANDVSRLSPGVYFVREEPQATSPKPQALQKVVIAR